MSAAADIPPADLARYSRQMLFEHVGVEGQRRLGQGRAVLVGCGALGSVLAGTLVRAGIGALRLIDRDYLELSNLQRQTLFDEDDVAEDLPKAEAAARKLRRVNSQVEIEPVVADLHADNAEPLCAGAHVILDGTDNLETRFLLNDVAVKHEIPWVYGACIGAEGLVLPILPRQTACLRCIWDEPPPPGSLPTCDTVGVLASAVSVVASLQAVEALKILMGRHDEVNRHLAAIDVWTGRVRAINVQAAFESRACPCCARGQYDFLTAARGSLATTLCGRDAVQIRPRLGPGQPTHDQTHPAETAHAAPPLFEAVRQRLPAACQARSNAFILQFEADGCIVTLFSDGRAIIKGTSEPAAARALYARYIGI